MKLWIARDKNNALGLYTVEPTLYDNKYYDGTYQSQMIDLDENLFPEVTFENSPQQVEIKLVKEE
jgi:hypothetical protein